MTSFAESGLTRSQERQVKRFMAAEAEFTQNPTLLCELTAHEFDHDEWLDDETHPLWAWALEYYPE